MKAKIARIQMDVDYKCPNCYLHFRFSNSKIPQRKQVSYSCPECRELLVVPPVFTKANQTTSFKKGSPKNNLPIKKLFTFRLNMIAECHYGRKMASDFSKIKRSA